MSREAVRATSIFFKRGRQAEGVDWQRTTKPRKYAAAQYTMLRGKLRKLLLIESVPGCKEYILKC